MATLDQLRLQQLLSPFNNRTGIVNTNQALPMINNNPFINTGAIDQRLQNTDLVNQIIAENQKKVTPVLNNDFLNYVSGQLPPLERTSDLIPGNNIEEDVEVIDMDDYDLETGNQEPLKSLGFGTNFGVANTPNVIGQYGTGPNSSDVYLSDEGLPYFLGDDGRRYVAPNSPDTYKKQSNYYGEPKGIAKLFDFLGNIPTPLNLARRGLEALSGFNQRIRNTDFGRSKTLMEYLGKVKERKAAEANAAATAAVYKNASDRGFTNDQGGFDTSAADKAGTSEGSGQGFSNKSGRGRTGF